MHDFGQEWHTPYFDAAFAHVGLTSLFATALRQAHPHRMRNFRVSISPLSLTLSAQYPFCEQFLVVRQRLLVGEPRGQGYTGDSKHDNEGTRRSYRHGS